MEAHRFRSAAESANKQPVKGSSPPTTAGRIELGGSAIYAARSVENWSLFTRTFAPAPEDRSPRGGSFVAVAWFPIFERPNSDYDTERRASLHESPLDVLLARWVARCSYFSS
jgi:hypothetical protein